MFKISISLFFASLLALALFIGWAYASRNVRAHTAERAGDAFITKLYADYQIIGKSCQKEDTDGDSYVSCDYRIKNAESGERTIPLQCPGVRKYLLGNTCKESRMVIQAQ
jgi:hypothetical protein